MFCFTKMAWDFILNPLLPPGETGYYCPRQHLKPWIFPMDFIGNHGFHGSLLNHKNHTEWEWKSNTHIFLSSALFTPLKSAYSQKMCLKGHHKLVSLCFGFLEAFQVRPQINLIAFIGCEIKLFVWTLFGRYSLETIDFNP